MNQLKLERIRKGWRQIDLSEAAGVSLTLIWILETSQGINVSRDVKEKIARALDCPVDHVFPEAGKGGRT
jgi:transcriptional regulator with XRE-family HTH domain